MTTYRAEEPRAVDLEDLTKGGVVVVCDSDDDWRDFCQRVAARCLTWALENETAFGLQEVEVCDLVNAWCELDPLDPHDFKD